MTYITTLEEKYIFYLCIYVAEMIVVFHFKWTRPFIGVYVTIFFNKCQHYAICCESIQ